MSTQIDNSNESKKVMRFDEYVSKDIVETNFDVNNAEETAKVENDEFKVVDVIDIFNPKSEKEESDFLQQNEASVIDYDNDIEPKNIKRGDVMYLTVLMERSTNATATPTKGILKVKVMDIYRGLSKLDEILKKKKKKK